MAIYLDSLASFSQNNNVSQRPTSDADFFLMALLNFDANAAEAFAQCDLPPFSDIRSALSRILNTPIVISL